MKMKKIEVKGVGIFVFNPIQEIKNDGAIIDPLNSKYDGYKRIIFPRQMSKTIRLKSKHNKRQSRTFIGIRWLGAKEYESEM